MRSLRTKPLIALLVLVSIAGLTQAFTPLALMPDNDRTPDLPSPACDELRVDPDQRLAYRSFAIGVQRYRWDGTTWAFVEPVATLYSDAEYHDKVGTHYAGPTWQGNSGGKVVGTRLKGCMPDPTAIAWLKLGSVSNDETGIFGGSVSSSV